MTVRTTCLCGEHWLARGILPLLLAASVFTVSTVAVEQGAPMRTVLRRAYDGGNYKEAYEGYAKLALSPNSDPRLAGQDLAMATECLRALGRVDEIDEFREKVIEVHGDNWRLLWAAANNYQSVEHYGFMIGGEFHRGRHRGGGQVVNATRRDRVRSLQLITQAIVLAKQEGVGRELSEVYLDLADILVHDQGSGSAWWLQHLTDISQLPDYDEGWYHGAQTLGAPVSEDGSPVFYYLPRTWESAANDGERWRFALSQAVEHAPDLAARVDLVFADFLKVQFGVQTLAQFGWIPLESDNVETDSGDQDRTGTFALHTLGEDETIARLATGVKRFTLPEEFNHVKIYQRVADESKSAHGETALVSLGEVFENRRQYRKAAEYWKRCLAEYGSDESRQERLNQIVGNWGRFDPVMGQPSGQGATVGFRFRNATHVSFTADEIDVAKLLSDVKQYLKSNPRELDWQKLQIENVGYRLVQENETGYLKGRVASWEMELRPRPDHFDKRITVSTPLQRPGAYLVTAKLADGNESKIVLWISDTAILKKPLADKTLYFLADASSGRPLENVNVEFFGYKLEHRQQPGANTIIQQFALATNSDGMVTPEAPRHPQDFQWLAIATTPQGRLGFLGFHGVWHTPRHNPIYDQVKTFTITDRPIYRPNQTVHWKIWVGRARYDQDTDAAEFANKSFQIQIQNPHGEKILDKTFTTDTFGGMAGEIELPADAPLGVYQINVVNYPGGGSFRVEEYKKPEFEVVVDAPSEPVSLGDTVQATIKANYYFGSPVTDARVKYKVTRNSYDGRWYPLSEWDWLYGRGYWWFGQDSTWYPGFTRWGSLRPSPYWWPQPSPPPEVVAEQEVDIRPDGTIQVEIDTTLAKEIHSDQNHRYEITAEVTDASRRTIVGKGEVLVAREPFQVFAWVDRGFYRVGDAIQASFQVQTLDGKPVPAKGKLRLYQVEYTDEAKPVETLAREWELDPDRQGHASLTIQASAPGQFRLSYLVTDLEGHSTEGGHLFTVRGQGFDSADFHFNALELVADKKSYQPGETLNLAVNTDRLNGTVLLFVRPINGVYAAPKVLRLQGKSAVEEIAVVQGDMPNFFVEAVTVAGGNVYTEIKQIAVPPEKRVLDIAVSPSQKEYKPGEKADVQFKLTGQTGEPFVGSTVVAVYDKAVEYISGGTNVDDIRAHFWKWLRHHHPNTEHNLDRWSQNMTLPNKPAMTNLGVFGETVADEIRDKSVYFSLDRRSLGRGQAAARFGGQVLAMEAAAPAALADAALASDSDEQLVEPAVRKEFADTALWVATLTTDEKGMAKVSLDMPENLTAWTIKVWGMGRGTRVGEGNAEVVTRKNLIVRLQAPRFFVQKDEVVLSANVHNYLASAKKAEVKLELDGGTLEIMDSPTQMVNVEANGEVRVDWRVKVLKEGEAVVRMAALTDEESDAMEMKFPVYVHGMLKMDALAGTIRPDEEQAQFTLGVPNERRVAQTRLEVRYSPTLAGAMVDALPYLANYPYGCTEQTLSRFLPTAITQKILLDMGLNLKAIREHRTNLNAQEIGNDQKRAEGWQTYDRNPVFDTDELRGMAAEGVDRLAEMQLSDGGWGWFSGWGERSMPHTTAYVVHGLKLAQQNDVAVVPEVLERGIAWLERYQSEQVKRLQNAKTETEPYKTHADNVDALVFMVLVDCEKVNSEMLEFLYRDRTQLAVYTKAMLALACHTIGDGDKLKMLIENIRQFEVHDDENQTAYLNLPGDYWWYWYSSDTEAHSYYLKLLARTDPHGETAPKLVKYLLNNRKHASYWNSTRDTAVAIEALAEYLQASGELNPDLTVEVWLDGEKRQEVAIGRENLFRFDNKFVLTGEEVADGARSIELRKSGQGPLYFNAYLTNFTLEDPIDAAGLEIKVERRFYRLVSDDKQEVVPGSRGQAVSQRVDDFQRERLDNLETVQSGDIVEVELVIESKNDYEYLVFEDMKAAGFEPVELQSGYTGNALGAYTEFRDNRVSFFVTRLARGRHSVNYRLRAEIPGQFSALPARGYAMYAPELKGNSAEWKLKVED